MQFQVAGFIRFMGMPRHSLRARRKACRDGAIIRNRLSLTHRQLTRQEFLRVKNKTNLQTQTRLMHGPVADLLLSSSRRCGQHSAILTRRSISSRYALLAVFGFGFLACPRCAPFFARSLDLLCFRLFQQYPCIKEVARLSLQRIIIERQTSLKEVVLRRYKLLKMMKVMVMRHRPSPHRFFLNKM